MKALFIRIFLLTFLVFAARSYAMDTAAIELLKDMKIDKTQVAAIVDSLVSSGRITEKQGEEAKQELKRLSDEDLKKYQAIAIEKVKNGDTEKVVQDDLKSLDKRIKASQAEEKRKPASIEKELDNIKIDFSKLGQ